MPFSSSILIPHYIMSFPCCYLTCLILLTRLGVDLANSQHQHLSIMVDPSGHGSFSTIQSAIDTVSSNNKYWAFIKVKAGTYREKLTIPYDKPNIALEGEGMMNTVVEWDDHQDTQQSATFTTNADNIVVKFISFRNTYNSAKNNNSVAPAVAAIVSGDKSYFSNVGFFGLQDTLWDDRGRHYYKQCIIEGAVDFIFGAGQSLYEECSISVTVSTLGSGFIGFITAQAREYPNDPSGFVFKNCNVFGNGNTYLGRAWRGYARVLFYNINMANIIQPSGWDQWNYTGHEDRITFAEYGNYGSGSDTSKRVSWTKKLDLATINSMTSVNFIDNEGWLVNGRL